MHLALKVVLGLSIILDLALGAWASVAWGSFAETWFPTATNLGREPQLLGLVLGLILIFFAVMQALALHWIRNEREGGFHFVICFGSYLVASSLIVFGACKFGAPNAVGGSVVPLGGIEFLLIDGLRGAALVMLGLLAMNEPATVRELRLPERDRTYAGRNQVDARPRGDRNGGERGFQRRGGRGRSNRERNVNNAPAASETRTERSGPRDRNRRQRSGAAGGSEYRDRRNAEDRNKRRPRGESIEPSRTPAEIGTGSPETDRSLAVVVRGDFRGGDAGGIESGEGRGSSEPGDRSRRRRGGRGRRRGGPNDASRNETFPGSSGSAPSSMISATAPKDAESSDRQSGSEFGRSRRPAGGRRK